MKKYKLVHLKGKRYRIRTYADVNAVLWNAMLRADPFIRKLDFSEKNENASRREKPFEVNLGAGK